MIRIPHKLIKNKITYLPVQFLFFDTETKPVRKTKDMVIQEFKLGWCCYWNRGSTRDKEYTKWFYYDDIGSFWDFTESLLRPKTRLVLIAHNVIFDFTVLKGWTELVNRGWTLTRLYEKGRTFIASYKKNSKTILILDNLNFFMATLKNLGKQIGIEKLDVDFNRSTVDELKVYCKRDVEIVLNTWQKYIKWFKVNDLGNFGFTISGQSFNTYRHKFMKHDIFIHNRRYVLKLERESYFGGRTECFKIGNFNNDKYYYLDINSMYPAVMKTNYYPCKYINYELNVSLIKLNIYLKKFCIIAKVLIDTKKPIIPTRINGKVVFPVGKFNAVLATPELKLALKENAVKKVLSIAIYQKEKIFTEYVDFFYNQRLKAKEDNNEAYILFFKLLLNSLYGKFGQRLGEWNTIGKCDPKEIKYWTELIYKTHTKYHFRKINGLVQRFDKPSESFNSFPAISSHVTSYARVKLYKLFEIAKKENVFYCDTDSLFVNQKGYDNLLLNIQDKELGFLKVEDITDTLKIFGCKQYIFGSRNKHKGLKKDAIRISDNTFKQTQWSSLKSLIISGNVNDYQVNDVIKQFTGIYDKGIVNEYGIVNPLVLEE